MAQEQDKERAQPFAWAWRNMQTNARGVYFTDPEECGATRNVDYEWTPLYVAPQPPAALPGEQDAAPDRQALIDVIAQGLSGTWHCTRVWEAWSVGTMSQDDFEPVEESDTPGELADAVLALLGAKGQQGGA